MGLDMYLEEKIYLGDVKQSVLVRKYGEHNAVTFGNVNYLVREKAVWRKAYQVMQFFERRIQTENGIDNCASYSIPYEDLVELRNLCKEILADHSKAEDLLPTDDYVGAYDDFYFHQLEETIKMLEDINPKYEYYFCVSW